VIRESNAEEDFLFGTRRGTLMGKKIQSFSSTFLNTRKKETLPTRFSLTTSHIGPKGRHIKLKTDNRQEFRIRLALRN